MLTQVGPEDISRLAQIVREETGNQVQDKNFSMLESRIRTHVLKLGYNEMSQYWAHFKTNERSEREILKGLMTTHYTFFFREFAHFEALDLWINAELPELKTRFEKTKAPFRIWSAACSRGQEVYSLAMFLELNLFKKHGVPYEIVGTDIDGESVAFAKNGVYPLKEVNTIPQIYLKGFWKKGTGPIKDFAAVHPSLKGRTRFESLNLLEIPKWSETKKFDVIFCRNVFIYFSEENVQKIALDLIQRLQPRGMFVSGLSEPLRFPNWTLASLGPSCYVTQPLTPKSPVSAVAPTVAVPASAPTLRSISNTSSMTPPQAIAPAAAEPVASHVWKPYRVLCVDDSKTIQTLIKNIFAQDPACTKVDVAVNGLDAREKLNAGSYDLITLDIHMPEMNGIEFLEQLYKRESDPPVLMVSSVNRTDIELATKSLTLGAFDYVEKPAMNNLQKSSDEILTKAKMAIRARGTASITDIGGFDASISQKIVVPDASQCLRIVSADQNSMRLLEQIIRGQKNEYRSPPMLVSWTDSASVASIEGQMLKWTDKQIMTVRDAKQILKPNQVYVVSPELMPELLNAARLKTVSLQVLDVNSFGSVQSFSGLKKATSLQVLMDESLLSQKENFARQTGFHVSDVTPATSFPSLSVEFFANLRKAVA